MNQPKKERFKTSVGGQALMEGIMMRGPKQMCCAVRKPDGTIETKLDPTPAHGVWTKIPLVRGAISMIESMIVGYRYMMYSAQVSMGDDYDPAEMEQLQPEVAQEPAMALEAGEDGLVFYRALAQHYKNALCPGGALVLEIGWQQREAVCALLAENGWTDIRCIQDFGGNDRCVTARRPK